MQKDLPCLMFSITEKQHSETWQDCDTRAEQYAQKCASCPESVMCSNFSLKINKNNIRFNAIYI